MACNTLPPIWLAPVNGAINGIAGGGSQVAADLTGTVDRAARRAEGCVLHPHGDAAGGLDGALNGVAGDRAPTSPPTSAAPWIRPRVPSSTASSTLPPTSAVPVTTPLAAVAGGGAQIAADIPRALDRAPGHAEGCVFGPQANALAGLQRAFHRAAGHGGHVAAHLAGALDGGPHRVAANVPTVTVATSPTPRMTPMTAPLAVEPSSAPHAARGLDGALHHVGHQPLKPRRSRPSTPTTRSYRGQFLSSGLLVPSRMSAGAADGSGDRISYRPSDVS